jgi:NAD kinase
MSVAVPRVVVVTRSTPYQALLAQRATRGQAEFFLRARAQRIEPVEAMHQEFQHALGFVQQSIPAKWRRAHVDRGDLSRFLFEPEDIVVVVGQDGLVANVAKYLDGQPVIGINPLPSQYDGILVQHPVKAAPDLLLGAAAARLRLESRTMVEATLDDGQRIVALNEIFVGHHGHQSARYQIELGERSERQSSSGLIVSTGTGSTGWARSINLARGHALELLAPGERSLAFFVREAFPSVATGVELTCGRIGADDALALTSEMDDGGVAFGDGIEDDHLSFARGHTLRLGIARQSLALVAR